MAKPHGMIAQMTAGAKKFRKKPVVIEAIQLTWANWGAVCDFIPKPWFAGGVWLDESGNPVLRDRPGYWRFEEKGHENEALGLYINTLEGMMLAKGNDWIIKGVNGEFYACKPDVFEKSYEEIK